MRQSKGSVGTFSLVRRFMYKQTVKQVMSNDHISCARHSWTRFAALGKVDVVYVAACAANLSSVR